jgi:HEAT repeat protein
MSALTGLVAAKARLRRRAVRALAVAPSAAAAFALRRVLLADEDASVRAEAAVALGWVPVGAEEWLLEATRDAAPMVREAAVRALARAGTSRAADAITALTRGDPVWWVRRAAVYALGVVAGRAGLPPLHDALGDPFWRVRHAAVQVLALMGAEERALRPELLAGAEGDAAAYLRALWGPAGSGGSTSSSSRFASRLPEPLRDPDPAVVTARLAALPAFGASCDPLALVELLCDPHEPLRRLAARRLAAAGDLAALDAALAWLDEPRIPHVAETVTRLCDSLGDVAHALAGRVLAGPARPGAIRWAIGWVVATGTSELFELARQATGSDPVARRLALPLATEGELAAALATGDPALAEAAARALALRSPSAIRTVLQPPAGGISRAPAARAWLVEAARRAADWPSVLSIATSDPHPGPRAAALAVLAAAGRLPPSLAVAARGDPDPAIREAAIDLEAAVTSLTPEAERSPRNRGTRRQRSSPRPRRGRGRRAEGSAGEGARGEDGPLTLTLSPLRGARGSDSTDRAFDRSHCAFRRDSSAPEASEVDPWVRRAAARLVRREQRHLAPAIREALAAALLADADPALRVEACALLDPHVPEGRAALLPLLGDREPMVQAAALDRLVDVDDATAALVLDGLARAVPPSRGAGDVPRAAAPPPPAVRGAPERRPLGRTGVSVSPLAVSGAFELSPGSLAVAAESGVDAFFWEPGYAAMTRFLRAPRQRTRVRVITGSYHADAGSLEADVHRALRRLRREALDIFLLFWARSPSRLDDDAFEALARLKQAGKIHAAGFSTHDRVLATAALQKHAWDVVMIRHSAAHPGIEEAFLPAARAAGAGVITFSALCYGRMLTGPGAPGAAECYRYAIDQPGVTACLAAPRRHRELVEDLAALEGPGLALDRQAALRAHGVGVRAENQRFNALLRRPTREAAQAALELLDAAADHPAQGALDRGGRVLEGSQRSRGRDRASPLSAMFRRGRP